MSAENLTLLMEAIPAQVNPELVVILMAVGALIKHCKKFEKIQNKLIPAILGAISFLVCFMCIETYTLDSVIHAASTAVVNAAASVYCHQIGKNIFLKKNNTDNQLPTPTPETDNNDIDSSVVF